MEIHLQSRFGHVRATKVFLLVFSKTKIKLKIKKFKIVQRGLEEYVYFEFYQSFAGWTKDEQDERRILIGENSISIKLTPIIKLIFQEV